MVYAKYLSPNQFKAFPMLATLGNPSCSLCRLHQTGVGNGGSPGISPPESSKVNTLLYYCQNSSLIMAFESFERKRLRSPILALAHLPAKVALVNVDKEVIFLLVSAHVDETNPTNVAPAGNLSINSLVSLSPLFTLGHVVRFPHVKITHLFSRISSRALWTREA